MSNVIEDQQAKNNIGANVRRLRGERSRSWLAREVGTYPIAITRIEAGVHGPGPGLLARLAEALDVTVDVLLSEPEKISANSAQRA